MSNKYFRAFLSNSWALNKPFKFFSSQEEEDSDERSYEQQPLEEGGELFVVQRALHTEVAPNLEQRENLFHTRCKIGPYLCTLIVDSGSCTNVASQELVKRLKLMQRDHTRP